MAIIIDQHNFVYHKNRYCIENRAADMMMNVYLALAMTISAAVDGIEKKIHPGEPTDQDLYNMTESEFKKAWN